MIDLYTAPTPNGYKISIMLEELGVPYTVHALSFGNGDQKKPEYLKLNPNGRIPTIVDRDNANFVVIESGAILVYLAEKYGRLLPADVNGRSEVMQWLMFQMGGLGPMQGQAHVFVRYWHEIYQPAIDRYQKETRRLYCVLDERLKEREYLCDDYSIADIASFPWVNRCEWSGVSIEDLSNLKAWRDRMLQRPAVVRGLACPPREEVAKSVQIGRDMLVR